MRPRRPTYPDWMEIDEDDDQLKERNDIKPLVDSEREETIEEEIKYYEEKNHEELPFPGFVISEA